MTWLWDPESEVLESWQEAAGSCPAASCIGDEGALVLEVGQEQPPLQ